MSVAFLVLVSAHAHSVCRVVPYGFPMGRNILHIIFGILLWIVFAYYWYLVVQRPITGHTQVALIIVGSLIVAITLFLSIWILHNRRIARRNDRRKKRPDAVEVPETDFLGRPFIESDNDELKRARYIEVHLVDIVDQSGEVVHKVLRPRVDIPEPGES